MTYRRPASGPGDRVEPPDQELRVRHDLDREPRGRPPSTRAATAGGHVRPPPSSRGGRAGAPGCARRSPARLDSAAITLDRIAQPRQLGGEVPTRAEVKDLPEPVERQPPQPGPALHQDDPDLVPPCPPARFSASRSAGWCGRSWSGKIQTETRLGIAGRSPGIGLGGPAASVHHARANARRDRREGWRGRGPEHSGKRGRPRASSTRAGRRGSSGSGVGCDLVRPVGGQWARVWAAAWATAAWGCLARVVAAS